MQEIARFLASHPPFDGLPPELLEQTAATVEIAYFPGGATILRQSGDPTRYLHVIVKGVVELRQTDQHGGSELVETLGEGRRSGSCRCCRAPRTCGTWSPARTCWPT